ncbi:hypothetical protein ACU8KH_05996 [Lachancea thermotolerans]
MSEFDFRLISTVAVKHVSMCPGRRNLGSATSQSGSVCDKFQVLFFLPVVYSRS